jgi:restriction endonuclease S subunit
VHQDEEGLPEKEKERQFLLDPHDHLIVDHDLYNHEGLTEDGIAEAFIEFAKKEKLSFFEIPPANATPLSKGGRGGSFDAVRYQRLMDGLEAIEIEFHEMLEAHRLDAEFAAHSETRWLERLQQKREFLPLNTFLEYISSGHTPYKHDIHQGDVRFITVECVDSLILDETKLKLIKQEHYDREYQKNRIVKRVVVCTIKRRICKAFPFLEEPSEPMAMNQDIAILIPKQNVHPGYLAAYLNSKVGQSFADRQKTGQMNPYISVANLSTLPTIILNDHFQLVIEETIRKAYSLVSDSKESYQQAEDLLLSELGLQDWQPTEETVAVKSFAESFLACDRLDAEYYQPKYDELESKFSQFDMLKICQFINYPVSSGATPKAGGDDYTDEENGIPFIRAVDLKDGRVDRSNLIYIKRSIHDFTLKKTKVKKNDVLFSIAGTVGRCAIFDHEFEANINQAISILRFEESQIKRLYLIVFFNSEIGKIYVAKYARQGLQTNLNLNEVSNLEIPVLGWNSQEKISRKVQESVDIKRKSKQLLEIAKTGVERAIETDEATATAWINQQLKVLGISPLFKGGRGDP